MPRRILSATTAREAVHLLILRELAKVRDGADEDVKGGANLRLFFGSLRYSEDIDLDGEPEASQFIRCAINGIFSDRVFTRTLQHIGIRGLDPGGGPNKDTETTFRYKFNVILPGDVRYPTKVEVSFRDRYDGDGIVVEIPDERIFRPYGIQPAAVRRYVRAAAVRQKISALGGRREAQARDVFDLHVLVGSAANESMLAFLVEGLERVRLEAAYKRALDITFAEFKGQVVEFLTEDARARYGTENVWDDLRLQAATLVETVLERKGAP